MRGTRTGVWMKSMVTGSSGWSSWVLALLLAIVIAPGPARSDNQREEAHRSETFGLVVGIDDYAVLEPLAGAVRDAEDIAASLAEIGARKTVLLLNHNATRDAILQAWDDLLEASSPGDTIIFSYAGHGGQEPEFYKGEEVDGRDETLLLAAFSPLAGEGVTSRERIVDNDIFQMLIRAKDRFVILVTDSCHSGTLTRRFDPRAPRLASRYTDYGDIPVDDLERPEPVGGDGDIVDLSHVFHLAAVQDDELSPELKIDGEIRGALSWAFARALRGQADQDQDGILTTSEIRAFVLETVRMVSSGRQLPRLDLQPVLRGQAVLRAGTARPQPISQPRPVTLYILGSEVPPDAAARIPLARLIDDITTADLIWDTATGAVVSNGDVIATIRPDKPEDLQSVIEKWQLVEDIILSALGRTVEMRLRPRKSLYFHKDQVTVNVQGLEEKHLALINLASDGTIQVIESLGSVIGSGFSLDDIEVVPPFGADHLIAIAAGPGMGPMGAQFARLHDTKRLEDLRSLLIAALEDMPHRLGVLAFTTYQPGRP